MIPDIYRELMAKLHNKTFKNEINWKTTADDDVYIVYFKEFSLTLRAIYGPDGIEAISVKILNSDGDVIDQFYCEEREDDYRILNETFATARRIALKIDVAIKYISEQLDKPFPVGEDIATEPTKKEMPDDDVPF